MDSGAQNDWTIERITQTFLGYMEDRGHAVIEGHSVMSPTPDVLFTTAGMHPLTPYLHGEAHPAGRRLTDVQRCVRTTDIEEVGDNRHLTVFEMLGNWSLGDYFKETSIPQSIALLTDVFGIDPGALYVTVFAGNEDSPRDDDAIALWTREFESRGVDVTGRINPLGAEDNWWSNGPTGLCGPDTEIFVYVGGEPVPDFADLPVFVEIWNNVFMTFDRADDGTLSDLSQRNVDTGMGLERLAMYLNRHDDVWFTDELAALRSRVGAAIEVDLEADLSPDRETSLRIVADHLRAALVIAAAGVHPSASRQGYALRKLVRRSVRHVELLRGTDDGLGDVLMSAVDAVRDVMGRRWRDIGAGESGDTARGVVAQEAGKFAKTLRRGEDVLGHEFEHGRTFDGELAFELADTFGYPAELSAEEAVRIGMPVDPEWTTTYETLREEQRARSRG
ncbi:alanine--tRNA ligase-related protein [soil metagenome]